MAKTDLERAFDALNGKLTEYNTLFSYAEGDQPLVYSTARLQEAFNDINCRFQQNWCAVVIDSALDRIELKGFDVQNVGQSKALEEIWNDEQIQLEAHDAHYAALVTHEAFVIVWKDEEGDLEVYYNDPRLCHMFYKADNPKVKEFACKWWHDETQESYFLTLYYPDRLEYYVAQAKNTPSSAKAFKPAKTPSASNPYDVIPVFHLQINRRSKSGELANILTLQDAVNKLLADMMVAAEFGAFAQRWVISNNDTKSLKNAPNEIWNIPAGDGQGQQSSVGQFQPTDLDNYLSAIDKLANSVAIISRTPKHYFYSAGTGISGEALLAMEAPLTKKVQQREGNFGVTWSEIAAFLLKLNGNGDIPPSQIKPIWEPAQSIQPFTEAQTLLTNINAGVPLVTQLKRQGWTEKDIESMQKDEEDAKSKTTSMASALLEQARIRQEQGNPPDNPLVPAADGDRNAR